MRIGNACSGPLIFYEAEMLVRGFRVQLSTVRLAGGKLLRCREASGRIPLILDFMNGRFRWCGACWVEGDRSVAVISLRGLPLCKLCEKQLEKDAKQIDAIKGKWDAMPAVDSGPTAAFDDAVRKCVETPKDSAFQIGEMKAVVMSTAAYIARFGSIKSKGMRQETMELWERMQALPMHQCLVLDVPNGKNPFKIRAALSNTIQRLVRLNKPPYRIEIGANNLKQLVVIAKIPAVVVAAAAKPA